ncbi:hypothetical protein SAMN06296065_11373 [Novosphingobium panipatense]|jgi:hypothetical protein|uniref:Conjugal transfer pilus assembly protein TraA n=1 Tax=Novosphingobium panipatense TaxID=428991 RepID=A0ABY1QTC0_9SPHN|nr:hypothetical protein SAMN06296065_11373 [Novosphingobium panipatense]
MRRAELARTVADSDDLFPEGIQPAPIPAGRVNQDAGGGGLMEPSTDAPADTDPRRCRQANVRTAPLWSNAMMRTFGNKALAAANIGLPLGVMALIAGPAHAFSAPAQGDLGYDIYDIVVNKGVKGPLGFVGGVAAFLFGVSRLFSNIMIGIPTIVAAVCLIKADSILQTFGMVV